MKPRNILWIIPLVLLIVAVYIYNRKEAEIVSPVSEIEKAPVSVIDVDTNQYPVETQGRDK